MLKELEQSFQDESCSLSVGEVTIFQPEKVQITPHHTIHFTSSHINIEIGPNTTPYAKRMTDVDWFLVEKEVTPQIVNAAIVLPNVVGIGNKGFEHILPSIASACAEEILLIDILTYWDHHHRSVWENKHLTDIFSNEAFRILKPGGCITIVEASDPAPIKKVSPLFTQVGFNPGQQFLYVGSYITPTSPHAYYIKYYKP